MPDVNARQISLFAPEEGVERSKPMDATLLLKEYQDAKQALADAQTAFDEVKARMADDEGLKTLLADLGLAYGGGGSSGVGNKKGATGIKRPRTNPSEEEIKAANAKLAKFFERSNGGEHSKGQILEIFGADENSRDYKIGEIVIKSMIKAGALKMKGERGNAVYTYHEGRKKAS